MTQVSYLTREAVEARRAAEKQVRSVTFAVTKLYGLSAESVPVPISEHETIDSGQVCLTLDPEAVASSNVGVIDFVEPRLTVKYNVQAVFPGLYELVTRGGYDPSLLNPVRATATDECTISPDYTGWRAVGCLDVLPGSLWAGTDGG